MRERERERERESKRRERERKRAGVSWNAPIQQAAGQPSSSPH